METTHLTALLRHFLASRSSDDALRERLQALQRRRDGARRVLQPKRLAALTREEAAVLLEDTDAYAAVRWNRDATRQALAGGGLVALRAALAELVRLGRAGLDPASFDALLGQLPAGLGAAYLAELLALRFPERYWPWNAALRKFLRAQGVDLKAELPAGHKSDAGAQYFAAGRHLADLRDALAHLSGSRPDFLTVAACAEWAAQTGAVRETRAVYHAGPLWTPTFPGFRAATFDAARARPASRAYRLGVREPLQALVTAVAPAVQALDAAFAPEPLRRAGGALRVAFRGPDDARLFVAVYGDRVEAGLVRAGEDEAPAHTYAAGDPVLARPEFAGEIAELFAALWRGTAGAAAPAASLAVPAEEFLAALAGVTVSSRCWRTSARSCSTARRARARRSWRARSRGAGPARTPSRSCSFTRRTRTRISSRACGRARSRAR
jgi:hypothetical protein